MVNGRLSSGNSAPNVQSRWPPPRRILPQRQSSLPAAPLTPAGANAYQMHLNSQLPVAQPNSGSLRHISSSCVSSASNSRLLLNSRLVQSMPFLNFAFLKIWAQYSKQTVLKSIALDKSSLCFEFMVFGNSLSFLRANNKDFCRRHKKVEICFQMA